MLHTRLRTNILSSGFTLIELMIVIVILAILAVVVIVAINPTQRIASSKNAKTLSDLASLGSSASQYAAQWGAFPPSFGGKGGTDTTGWSVSTAPLDGNGVAYVYKANPTACTTACTAIAVLGTSLVDGSDYPPGSTTAVVTGVWCWRSATGQITNLAAAGSCIP